MTQYNLFSPIVNVRKKDISHKDHVDAMPIYPKVSKEETSFFLRDLCDLCEK